MPRTAWLLAFLCSALMADCIEPPDPKGISGIAYNPLTATASPMPSPRSNATVALLPDGRVLIGSAGETAVDIYEPFSNRWKPTAPAPFPLNQLASTLRNGKVLVQSSTLNANSMLFDPVTETWALVAAPALNNRILAVASVLDDGRLFLAGGAAPAFAPRYNDVQLFNPDSGTWATAKPMSRPRSDFAATVVNGKVLVHDGVAELYDPVADVWVDAGVTTAGTDQQSSTLLPNGKILVATLGSFPQLYDPVDGGWSNTGPMATIHRSHTATLLTNGQLLVAGGENGSVGLASLEVYDSTTNAWSDAGVMKMARLDHTAAMLPTGRVLLLGGFNTTGNLASTELFDSFKSAFTDAPAPPNAPRGDATLSLLPNAKALMTGGDTAFDSAFVYEPSSSSWTSTRRLLTGRSGHTATVLSNGKVLVTGGKDSTGAPLASCEVFDSAHQTWNPVAELKSRRSKHSAVLLANGKVLVVGGNGPTADETRCEIFDPTTAQWAATGSLPDPIGAGTATLLQDGRVLAVGSGRAALYAPSTGNWTVVTGKFPSRGHTTTLLADGRVLISGGDDGLNSLASVVLFDPSNDSVTPAGNMTKKRRFHTATLLRSARVLFAGGEDPANSGAELSAEIYDPVAGTFTGTGALPSAQAFHRAVLLPTGLALLAGGDNTAVLFDEGLGPKPTWAPLLDALPPATPGAKIPVTGARLTGISEGSGGHYLAAPANLPVIMLLRQDNGLMLPATSTDWTSSTATVLVPANLPVGQYWAYAVVNGIPSQMSNLRFSNAVVGPCTSDTECSTGRCVVGACCDEATTLCAPEAPPTQPASPYRVGCDCSTAGATPFALVLLALVYRGRGRWPHVNN
ncbi:MAG: hypothetical protein K1X64_09415 [Myxococcaceae bacterium]|nr:hypothetical protein [Myxococcaceae bacterium]